MIKTVSICTVELKCINNQYAPAGILTSNAIVTIVTIAKTNGGITVLIPANDIIIYKAIKINQTIIARLAERLIKSPILGPIIDNELNDDSSSI
jgi:hypothetical protein